VLFWYWDYPDEFPRPEEPGGWPSFIRGEKVPFIKILGF
jgi:hypothetical protein